MNKQNVTVVIHNVRSAYNVGSIFRTADAAGIEKIYLTGYTPTPHQGNPSSSSGSSSKLSKTALGAERSVSWEHHRHGWRVLEKLRSEGFRIVALEQHEKSIDLFSFTPHGSIALLVGHERVGLSKRMLKLVDDIVEISMYGSKESLNVSVAFGIAAYTLIHRIKKRSRAVPRARD